MPDEERKPGPAEQRERDILTLQRAGALLRRLSVRSLGWAEVLGRGRLCQHYEEEAAVVRLVVRDVAEMAERFEAEG